MTRLRSLHVVTTSQRRGAEQAAVDLAETLSSQGGTTQVVALTAGPQGNPLGVDVLGRRPLGVGTLVALRRAAAASDTDLVVAHGSRTLPASVAALAGTVGRAGRSAPLVYRNIGDPRAWAGRGLRRWRVAQLLRRTSHVVAMWPGAADALTSVHGVDAARITVIPNGVPAARCPVPDDAGRRYAREALGLPASAPVVATIGALSPEKQVGTSIGAVGKLDDVHLLVVGDGPDRAALDVLAADVAPDRVHFTGVLPGPQQALAAADALVLTSRTEGLPGVLVEAGLSALPAVASAVGGVGEIVRHGETGLLVEPGDIGGFADGLRQVLDAPRAYGDSAREHCLTHFEIGVVARRWATMLDELVSGRLSP